MCDATPGHIKRWLDTKQNPPQTLESYSMYSMTAITGRKWVNTGRGEKKRSLIIVLMAQRLRSLFHDAFSSLGASRVNTQVLMYSTALTQSQTLWQRGTAPKKVKNKSMLTGSKAHHGVTDTVLLWSPDQRVNFSGIGLPACIFS